MDYSIVTTNFWKIGIFAKVARIEHEGTKYERNPRIENSKAKKKVVNLFVLLVGSFW
jgi:hypothetical protein